MAVAAYSYGGHRYGGAAYAGSSGSGPGGNAGTPLEVLFLEANDRHQIVACITDGTNAAPIFVYWNPAPADWGEALAAPYPGDYPDFFALDGAGGRQPARWESRWLMADSGVEVDVQGVVVLFHVRPSLMDSFDGGVEDVSPFIRLRIEGYGVEGVLTTSELDSLESSVVTSDPQTWTLPDAADVARFPWPNPRRWYATINPLQPLIGYRIIVEDCFGVEFLEFKTMGIERPLRAGR